MMALFSKMLMLRQLKVEPGTFSLLGQRVCVTPRDTLVAITRVMMDQPNLIPSFYESFRTSFGDGWAEGVKKTYGFKKQDYFKWLIDIANISGWGENKLISFDSEKMVGVFNVRHSPIGEALQGKYHSPVDHIWRGLTAGGTSKVFETPIDWIETKCVVSGNDFCEYRFMPRSIVNSDVSVRQFVSTQLPAILK